MATYNIYGIGAALVDTEVEVSDAFLVSGHIDRGVMTLVDELDEDFSLMGVWDHFYNNSALNQSISTHYVNLPNYTEFQSKPKITLDDQHGEFKWFDLAVVSNDEKFHPYMRNYASWLLDNMENTDD